MKQREPVPCKREDRMVTSSGRASGARTSRRAAGERRLASSTSTMAPAPISAKRRA